MVLLPFAYSMCRRLVGEALREGHRILECNRRDGSEAWEWLTERRVSVGQKM